MTCEFHQEIDWKRSRVIALGSTAFAPTTSGVCASVGTTGKLTMWKLSIITKMKQQIPLGAAVVKPGEILAEEFLEPLGLTHRELARRMGVSPMRVNEIVRGKRAITAGTALKLAEALGTSARFWMNLQTNYDLATAALAQSKAA